MPPTSWLPFVRITANYCLRRRKVYVQTGLFLYVPSDCSVAVAPWYELEVIHLKVTKTSVPPVYQGVLTIEVTNEGLHPVALQPGECFG